MRDAWSASMQFALVTNVAFMVAGCSICNHIKTSGAILLLSYLIFFFNFFFLKSLRSGVIPTTSGAIALNAQV